jgi:hypothetical protein
METLLELKVGSNVQHVRDDSLNGVVVEMDEDLGGVTTCRVVWGAKSLEDALAASREDQDIQWTTKLLLVD